MDIESSNLNLKTPVTYNNLSFCKTEDSGYHTSFECSNVSNESLDPSLVLSNYCKLQVECNLFSPSSDVRSPLGVLYTCSSQKSTPGSSENTPLLKRGIKRPHEENVGPSEAGVNVATPTTVIANEVQKLKVNDTKLNSTIASSESNHFNSFLSDIYYKDYYDSAVSHPTTPIKKICKTGCNLSPFNRRKSSRRVDFTIHSLSCERQVLKLQPKPQLESKVSCSTFSFKPNQKIDIIKLLYIHEDYCSTSIRNILSYLSQEDVYNFTLVSPTWCTIFKNTNTRKNSINFFNRVKSNLENWDHGETPKTTDNKQTKPLKEIQNVSITRSTPRSPIRSPRTTRFTKFTKAASLDGRSQLACIKCGHPAKVNVEPTGEEWVECISFTCSHQYCKLCKSERHPGKSCVQYDLIDGPSPSKRKKNGCSISSNKSKKKLKRLLF